MILPTAITTWHRAMTHQVPWGWADVARDNRTEQKISNRIPKTKIFFDEILRHDKLTGAQVWDIKKMSGAAQNSELINAMIREGLIAVTYRKHGEQRRIASVRVLKRVDYFDHMKAIKGKSLLEKQRDVIQKSKIPALKIGQKFTRLDIDVETKELQGYYMQKLVENGVAKFTGTHGIYIALVDVYKIRMGEND
jgi:hypothetical protein